MRLVTHSPHRGQQAASRASNLKLEPVTDEKQAFLAFIPPPPTHRPEDDFSPPTTTVGGAAAVAGQKRAAPHDVDDEGGLVPCRRPRKRLAGTNMADAVPELRFLLVSGV